MPERNFPNAIVQIGSRRAPTWTGAWPPPPVHNLPLLELEDIYQKFVDNINLATATPPPPRPLAKYANAEDANGHPVYITREGRRKLLQGLEFSADDVGLCYP